MDKEEILQYREMNNMMLQTMARMKDGLAHRHNWVALEWESTPNEYRIHGLDGMSLTTVTKFYCPDCKQTQEVKL